VENDGGVPSFFPCGPFLFYTQREEKMVTITINGEKKEREFQNMAQALAFAYQNGVD
jgi:hypothetical protein